MSTVKNIDNFLNNFFEEELKTADVEIFNAISKEFKRQENHIELIASENIVSRAVLEAQGSVLTNKYAEGYSGKRYYGGCEFVDIAENLAIERAKKLFNCKYANVQPHSGAQANGAVYLALVKPGDTILGMSLNSGGHLTHGAKVSLIRIDQPKDNKGFRAPSYLPKPFCLRLHKIPMKLTTLNTYIFYLYHSIVIIIFKLREVVKYSQICN